MENHKDIRTTDNGCEQYDSEHSECNDENSSLLHSAHQQKCQQFGHYGGISTYSEPSTSHEPLDALSSSTAFLSTEERLKRKIKLFFMNPIEKWKTKGKIPWKLALQLAKIVFVTIQLVVFATDGYTYEIQKQNTRSSFRHLFLLDWTAIREVASYPPSTGPYAVYTKPEFYNNVNHAIRTFTNITALALGSYMYDNDNGEMSSIIFYKTEFEELDDLNHTVVINNKILADYIEIPQLYPKGDALWNNFSLKDYLHSINKTINFNCLVKAELTFVLRTIFLKSVGDYIYPDYYRFNITIMYDNSDHDGEVLVALKATSQKLSLPLTSDIGNSNAELSITARQILNVLVIMTCFLSLVLCIRCLYRGRILRVQTESYFKYKLGNPLGMQDKMEFVDGWYCMMVVNDVLIIVASVLKACIEKQTIEGDQYNTCAILLGVGNLLVWAGLLRYLGFFRKYNILILTVKKALPNVLRFMLASFLLYCGFCFCGWIAFGPYHIKFRTLSSTSECLFAMMNGDDLFATFFITNTDSELVWWFSRIYLYSFIIIFISVVISLFISVIMDSYETVKEFYRNGGKPTRIQEFIADCTDDSCSSFYRMERLQRKNIWSKVLHYWKNRNSGSSKALQ